MKNTLLTLLLFFIFSGWTKSQSSENDNELVIIDNIMYQNQTFNSRTTFTEKEKISPNFLKRIMKNVRRTTWSEAKNYCEELELGGFSDWQLPTHQTLEKISIVNIYYGLGNYNTFDDYAKQHLKNAKKHVVKIKTHRVKSSIGSELIVKKEFLENMPLINSKNMLGEFWTIDERDEYMAMTLDFRNAVAWRTEKTRNAYVLCSRNK